MAAAGPSWNHGWTNTTVSSLLKFPPELEMYPGNDNDLLFYFVLEST